MSVDLERNDADFYGDRGAFFNCRRALFLEQDRRHRTGMIAGMATIFIGLLVLDGRVVRAVSVRPFGTTTAERQPLG